MATKTPTTAAFRCSTLRLAVVAALAVSPLLLLPMAMAADRQAAEYYRRHPPPPQGYRPAGGVSVWPTTTTTAQEDPSSFQPDFYATAQMHAAVPPAYPPVGRGGRPAMMAVQNVDFPGSSFPVGESGESSGDEVEAGRRRQFFGVKLDEQEGTAGCGVQKAKATEEPFPPLPPLTWFKTNIDNAATKIKQAKGSIAYSRSSAPTPSHLTVDGMYGETTEKQKRYVLRGEGLGKKGCTKNEVIGAMVEEYDRWASEKGIAFEKNDTALEAMKLMVTSALDQELSGRAGRMWKAFKKLPQLRFCCKRRQDGIYDYLYAIKNLYKGDRKKACSLLRHSVGIGQYIAAINEVNNRESDV